MMTAQKTVSAMPRWRQIEEALVREIASGAYGNARFPTEMSLSARFGVNRHTIRRAMAALAERGLLRIEQGRGAFLVADAIEYALGPRTRFSENLLRQGRSPALAILGANEIAAEGDAMRWLGLRRGTRLWRIETLGQADGRAISVGTHYFPAAGLPDFPSAVAALRSITRALARSGIENYRRARTRVTARPATPSEAQQLGITVGRPLLITESLNVDPHGRAIEFGVARFVADRVQLVVDSEM
jgi:GntR family phosphonate transport system transcriptional regulator